MPGGGALRTAATDFFCGAVAAGSNGLRRSLEHPLPALAALAVLLGADRLRVDPHDLAARRRRSASRAAAPGARRSPPRRRMYAERLWLFLGIGVLALPVSVVVTLLQSGFLHVSSIFGVETEGEGDGVLVFGVVAIGTTLTLLGLGLVMAATARALVELDAGRPVDPLRAYRLALRSVRPLLGALLVVTITVSLCLATVVAAAGRDLARRPLGARRPGRGARGPLGLRRARPQPAPRPAGLAQGRLAGRGRRRARVARRPVPRRAADPADERARSPC